MIKFKLNAAALYLATLFLLSVFSVSALGQKNFDKYREKVSQAAAIENERTVLTVKLPTKPARFFPNDNTFPKAGFPTAAKKQAATYTRPNSDERFKKYLKRTFGPYALVGDVASAGFAQITDSPEEWENNSKGFGRRLASTVGKSIIKETTIYGLDEALKLDSSFYKSGSKKFNERLKNAVLSTFTARKPNGKRVVGIPRLVGTYTSSIIAAETWYPARYNYKDGLRSGTISLGVSVGINLIKEIFQK